MGRPGAPHGRLGDLGPERRRADPRQPLGECALAAAEVEDMLARAHALAHEREAHVEVRGLEVIGQVLPQVLVVLLHPQRP